MSIRAEQHFVRFIARQVNCVAQASFCPVTSMRGRAWYRAIVARGRKTFGGS
jgi:hypothetical protein